jgi:predicted RND superfamily exporter protein
VRRLVIAAMLYSVIRRFAPLICISALLSWPFLLLGAKRAFDSNTNNVLDWLPNSFDETQRLAWFVHRFGSDEILVISWPGCALDDDRLDRLAVRLTEPVRISQAATATTYFRHVFTGRQTLRDLQAEPLNLARQEALARMRGWILGGDEKTTCAVALVSSAGTADRDSALEAVYQVARACGLPPESLHIGGPTADSVAINRASQQWALELTGLAVCACMLVAWWCLKVLRLVAGVFIVASFAWSVSLAAVYYSGANMDAVLYMMPGLVFVLGVSGAVHLTNYYRSAVKSHGARMATSWAISHGWLPCTLACGTTAIGLGSLALSQIKPISKFGTFSAIGAVVVMVTLLTLWPATIQWWASRGTKKFEEKLCAQSKGRPLDAAWWQSCFRLSTGYPTRLLCCTGVLLALAVAGVFQIRASAKLEDLLPERSKLIRDYAWLQDNVGPLVPVEIVLQFRPYDHSQVLRRAQIVEHLRRQVDALDHVGGTTAATTFLVDIPEGRGVRQIVRRRVIAGQIQESRDKLIQLRYLYDDKDAELWRISTRVSTLGGVDYGELLGGLEQEVAALLATEQGQEPIQVEAKISGAVPLIYMAQQQLLRDLIKSFLIAFLLIAIVLTVVVASPSAGLLAMIPNVFPALIVFGYLGWAGSSVDIGAMMTASAALGIAVDDTLHFLVWFRRGAAEASTRRDAIRYAFEHCATPMVQTSLICGFGFLVFVLSPFGPTARFGWLMAIMLSLAAVADLVLLPAMLASPLGHCFVRKKDRLKRLAAQHVADVG